MTKIPSVEKEIEYLRFAMRGGCNCKGCEDDRANIGEHCVIRQALTADRLALLTELRDSGLLEEKEDDGGFTEVGLARLEAHNTLARDIKEFMSNLNSV